MNFFGQDRAIAIADALIVNWALQLLDLTNDKIAGIGEAGGIGGIGAVAIAGVH
jgi:hypothetical protein